MDSASLMFILIVAATMLSGLAIGMVSGNDLGNSNQIAITFARMAVLISGFAFGLSLGCFNGYPVTPAVASQRTGTAVATRDDGTQVHGMAWPVSAHSLISAGEICGEISGGIDTDHGQVRAIAHSLSTAMCLLEVSDDLSEARMVLSASQPPMRERLVYVDPAGVRVDGKRTALHQLSSPWHPGSAGAPLVAIGWAGFGEVDVGKTWSGVSGVVVGPSPGGGTWFAPISEVKRFLVEAGEDWRREPGQDVSTDGCALGCSDHAWPADPLGL